MIEPMRHINGVNVLLYELALEGEAVENKEVSIRRPVHRKQQIIDYEMLDSLPKLGPVYRTSDQRRMAESKDEEEAWWKVICNSSLVRQDSKDLFLDAVRRVEKEARATYAVNIECKSSEFRLMMARDGYIFLHLALLVLGKSSDLKYPEDDPFFGRKRSKKKISQCVEAMFLVGNQIPLVVLKELIKLNFFQDAIEREKANWLKKPQFGLCKKILYEQLIEPEIEKSSSLRKKVRNRVVRHQQPCDMLHALLIQLLGPVHTESGESTGGEDEEEDDDDFDANGYSDDDDEKITNQETNYPLPSATEHDDQNNNSNDKSIISLLNKIVLQNAIDNRNRINLLNKIVLSNTIENQNKRIFSSASELKQSGIHIKKLPSGGIRSIHFENYYFWANLYLPGLQVDHTTEVIFRQLKIYEECQPLYRRQRELSSYLRLMSDLIQTQEDIKLLKEKGIIAGRSEYAEPEVFSRLSSSDTTTLTQQLRNVRSKMVDYSSPWIHYRRIIDLVAFLTVLQAIFAMLAYFKPPN